jgi:diadenosine tetraphosphate (Ap4A) HIT family hydrolase
MGEVMTEWQQLDIKVYLADIQSKPCFICAIISGDDTSHQLIYRDEVAIAFLSKYPTLYGYVIVAPLQHREQVTGDFTLDEYLALQRVVYRIGEAVRQALPCERLYILSLGSQQGNRHVHWHIAPLPPGVPFEQQQLEALSIIGKGYLQLTDTEMGELAARIRQQIGNDEGANLSANLLTPRPFSATISSVAQEAATPYSAWFVAPSWAREG